jgi:adenylate cyclase
VTDADQQTTNRNPRWRATEANLRIVSGLILFAFVVTHFINHAMGLISVELMQAGQDLRLPITRSLFGTVALSAAIIVHAALGIWKLLTVRTWRLGWRNIVQLAFGLLIPIFLIRHALGTRGVAEVFGIDDNYSYALWAMWPGEAWNQVILMLLVWVHSCIGLHHWLEAKQWYRRAIWLWYGLAVLIPTLSYAGFVEAGRRGRLEGTFQNPFAPGQYDRFQEILLTSTAGYYSILGLAIAVWVLMLLANRLRPRITVKYANGPTVLAPLGLTVLDISRTNRIPHASVCGGRARCSTCRVRVIEGLAQLPPPSDTEKQVLRRVGAPPNVRLACQLRPTANLQVSTLLPAGLGASNSAIVDKYHWGVEQEVTILFCDLRGFTKMSEGRLSFDVVFLLNQFLGRMAEAIEDTGGFVDKFMGDGIMAIFGIDAPSSEGAANALAAARAMGGVLDSLNQSLRDELRMPLSMGIGIHTGPAILGRIGAAQRTETVARLTALGETVNIASRLESKTKDLNVQVAVSARCMDTSGMAVGDKVTPLTIELRGLSKPIEIFAATRATELAAAG